MEKGIDPNYLKNLKIAYDNYFNNIKDDKNIIFIIDTSKIDIVNNLRQYKAIVELIKNYNKPGIYHFNNENLI